MKQTITESGGLYWLQHSPPKALLKVAIGAHRTLREYLRDTFERSKPLFSSVRSFADERKSLLVVGSAGEHCVSPCLQRMPRRTRRLVVLAR
jgi:hypothetical protein